MAEQDKIKKIIQKATQLNSDNGLGLAKEFIDIEDGISEIKDSVSKINENVDKKLNGITEELKKKLESELVLEIDREELAGEDGMDGFDGYTPVKGVDYFDGKDGYTPIKGKDYFDGVDGKDAIVDINQIAEEASKFVKIPEINFIEKASLIRDSLESLKDEDRLPASAIKDLPEFKDNIQRVVSANRYFYQHLDVDVAGVTIGQSIKWNGISWITYTPTDVGGVWGAITGTITDQTDLMSLLNAKQATLVSGTNIKTINGNSLLGSGDLTITGYSDEEAQDAVGAMIDTSLSYVDATPLLKINESYAHQWATQQRFDTNVIVGSTLGSEKLTNGTFTGNANSWSLQTGYAYSSNTVLHNANGTGTLSQTSANMATPLVIGETYTLSFVISAWTVGTVTPSCGGVTLTARGADGTYTETFVATSTASLLFTPTNTARFTIDTISLKKITGGVVSGQNYYGKDYTGTHASLGTTTTPAFIAENMTPATASVLQASPSYLRRGQGFTSSGSVSYPFEIQDYAIGMVNISPYGKWINQWRGNSGSWAEFISFDADPAGNGFSFTPPSSLSNSSPGTTRNITINNTGSNSWIDFKFSGTRKSHIGADSNGAMKFYAGGGSYFEFYQMSGGSLFAYMYPTALVHSGGGWFGSAVGAGSQSQPTSMLQNQGGTALKVKRLIANGNLDNSATHWLLDATSASSCTGTPSASCASWTNEGDCLANDAHGGCSWFAGNSCSAFDNESGMGTCAGTSGCSVATSACSGGDETSCLANDDAYGGSCSWTEGFADCSPLDESTCGSTSGCTQNYNYCSWDGMSCSGLLGVCDLILDEGTCVTTSIGFASCSGTYSTGYSCGGTYNTGSCTGTYGASCSGTATCSVIDDSTSCGAETGCTWSAVLNAQLPDGETCPDRTYWLYNDSSGGADVMILPYSGQTVNETTSYTLASYRDWVHFAYYKKTADCSAYDGSEATCGSTSGCQQNYNDCSSFGDEISCIADAHCTWNGSSCDGGSHFHSCSGTYTLSKNWYKFGS